MSKGLDRRSEEASKRATSLEESAERLFNDLDQRPYLAGPYLDHLRENLRDLGAAFGRSLTLSLLVLAAFELLTRAAVNRASLGPFEISDLSLIQKALPVIASYLFYDLMTIAFHGGVVSLVYQRILQLLHPKLEKADLLILVAPHRSLLIPQRIPGASRSGLHARLALVVYTIMLLAVPFWLIYAFLVLFRRFELTDFTVWAALVLSLLFVVLGGTVLASPFGKRRAVD